MALFSFGAAAAGTVTGLTGAKNHRRLHRPGTVAANAARPHSPRLQHSLTQTYPRSRNLLHTHPRPMRRRGRQPVATAGGAWVGRSEGQTWDAPSADPRLAAAAPWNPACGRNPLSAAGRPKILSRGGPLLLLLPRGKSRAASGHLAPLVWGREKRNRATTPDEWESEVV